MLLIGSLAILFPPLALAQERQSLSSGRDDKALQAMQREFNWDFKETPLTDMTERVSEWCGINVWLDVKAMEDVGVGDNVPLTFKAKRVSVEVALERMLHPLELTWTVMDGLIVITTPEVVERHLIIRIYNVQDLLAKGFRSGGGTSYDFDSLIELITGTIQPNTWDAVGGPANVQTYSNDFEVALVISQTYDVHNEIDDLFRLLRMLPGEGRRSRVAHAERTSRGNFSSAGPIQRRTVLAPAWPAGE